MSTFKGWVCFIIANILVVCFVLFVPKWPLPVIGALLLLIANFICYTLFKARAERNLSRVSLNVGRKEVKSSTQLLRYAASAMAFISFITTAEGMKSFVFNNVSWQAYLASFAVQSILLVFNFLFFHFYVRIKHLKELPSFFKRALTYCIVFLFTGALIVSSTFSFVFIANNTYKIMRPKNSNITIEKFLTEEAYNLSRVNDEIGEKLRKKIVDKTGVLKESIGQQRTANNTSLKTKINEILDIEDLARYEQAEEFYSQEEYEADVLIRPSFAERYEKIFERIGKRNETYTKLYEDDYLPAYNFYDGFKKEEDKSAYTDYKDLKARIDKLTDMCRDGGRIDDEISEIDGIEINRLVHYIADYKDRAKKAFRDLKSNMKALCRLFERIRDEAYGENAETESTVAANEENITDIFTFVYNNEYDSTEAERILGFLSEQREAMRRQNADGAGQSGSTSQPDSTSEPDNQYEELAKFTEAFNSFVNYTELKKQIKDFIDDRLSITYYIKSEGESDPAPSGEGGHTYKTVSEAEWTQERKQDFVVFISCLKGLPDLEKYKKEDASAENKEKEDASVKNEEEASALMKDYDQQAVLEEAYTLNRDLLEKISDFEKAINYFKYDFRLMAVLSAIMALFMDLASFLTGGFMFGASFFDELKKPKKQKKQQKPNP